MLRRQALADGLMDAAFNLVMERRRPETERSAFWQARWTEAITLGLSALDADCADPPFDLGWIAALCAGDYVEFRLAGLGMAAKTPKLTAWRTRMAARVSVAETAPPP